MQPSQLHVLNFWSVIPFEKEAIISLLFCYLTLIFYNIISRNLRASEKLYTSSWSFKFSFSGLILVAG